MSPPVGVVRSRTRSARAVQRVEVDDVHHHVGRHEQRQGGDRDPDDAVGRPRSLRPLASAGARRAARHGRTTSARAGSASRPTPRPAARRSRSRPRRCRRARAVRPRRRRPRRDARQPVRGRPGSAVSVRSVIATGNDASRQPIASSRPVALNATWVAIDMPEPVRRHEAGSDDEGEGEQAGVLDRPEVDHREPHGRAEPGQHRRRAGREGPLQQAAVDDLLDDRCADADHHARAGPSTRRSARSASFSAVSESLSSENVAGQRPRSGM